MISPSHILRSQSELPHRSPLVHRLVENTLSSASGSLETEPTVYLHIGLQYGSPFRPTVLLMLSDDTPTEEVPSPEYVLLREAGDLFSVVRLAAGLHQGYTWTAQLYELEATVRPIANMTPGTLGARRVDAEPQQIWPVVARARTRYSSGRRHRPGRGPRPKALPAPGDESEDGSSSGSGAAGEEGSPARRDPVDGDTHLAADSGSEDLVDDVAAEQAVIDRELWFADFLQGLDEIMADGGQETLVDEQMPQQSDSQPAAPGIAHGVGCKS